MVELNLDYDIIKEFIPIDDKSSFLVFSHHIIGAYIFANYKMLDGPFDDGLNLQEKFSWERTVPIPKSDYIKEKRERELKQIIDSN